LTKHVEEYQMTERTLACSSTWHWVYKYESGN